MKTYIKYLLLIALFIGIYKVSTPIVYAGWVNGYYRSNGTYVSGYYRTEPDMYKWNNYSFNGDWSDSYNDNTFYKKYGYDPEPLDTDYVSSYSRNSYRNRSNSILSDYRNRLNRIRYNSYYNY